MNAIEHLDFINELFSEEEGFMTFTDTPVKDEEEVEMRQTQPITYKIQEDKGFMTFIDAQVKDVVAGMDTEIKGMVGATIPVKRLRFLMSTHGFKEMPGTVRKDGKYYRVFSNEVESLMIVTHQDSTILSVEVVDDRAETVTKQEEVAAKKEVSTPVQKEVIAPVRDFINSEEDAVRTNAILLRFLEVAKGRSMQGLGTIVKRYLSVRYLPALKTKNYTIHVFQVNAYYQQKKIRFAVIERDGVLLSSRLMSREEFNSASKYSALAKKKAFYKKNMFHAYTGK